MEFRILTTEEAEALYRMLQKRLSTDYVTYSIEKSPAQVLRERADEMEKEERDTPLLRSILGKLKMKTRKRED